MCRNIRVLYNFEPPANSEEVVRGGAPVRAQGQRFDQTVAGQ